MLTLPISDSLTVSLYNSIKEFPAARQLDAKLFAIEQAGLSLSPEELEVRKERLDLLLAFNQQADYQLEAYNYQLSITLLEQGYNPVEPEWACHVQAINGEPVTDYSEDALGARVTALKQQGLSLEQIETSLATVKAEMLAEIKRYYPNRVIRGKYNNLQRQLNYGIALADHLALDTEETKAKLDKTTLDVLTMQKPIDLRDETNNTPVSLEKSQFRLYTRLQESGCNDVNSLTVYQFYGWLEMLEERNEQQALALAKAKKR
ncbi:hypothetical protein GO755_39840 [Spirosoma sp. HMF4905]|uniref:Uncharacterized protein n=1 Tax=Spirosoma arboris TaxID=2682092 RepID=A0A7K1SR53_9BACT|nr:hypothetical protein [Spirosoma arboris]MVM36230.1 hypothetical protein [Spirosoma arboris]